MEMKPSELAFVENIDIKTSELVNADVVIVLGRNGAIINGTNGVLDGKNSALGVGVLGRMTLGR